MSNIMLNKLQNQRLLSRFVMRQINGNNVIVKHLKTSKCLSNIDENTKQNTENNSEKYDIIINGGGIVGFSLLTALKSSPFLREKRITLIEKELEPKSKVNSQLNLSNRVSSITTSSKEFFQRIGVWNDLKQFAKPIKQMYVWSHRFSNGINFRSNDYNSNEEIDDNNEVICYVIENNRILSSLHSRINESDHEVCYGTVVTDIKSDGNLIEVKTKCEKNDYSNSLKTSLLVGCDGFNSIVRNKSDLYNFEHDLEQIGIVGTIAVSSDDSNVSNDISFQRFVPFDNSVIALLPLTRDYCSFVLSVPKEMANRLMQMNEQQFVDHLNDILFSETTHSSNPITNKLDEIMSSLAPKQIFAEQTPYFSAPHVLSLIPDSRAAFPLKFSTTVPFIVGKSIDRKDDYNNIVIIGDAAHRVHPLAGQGLNLGIGDVNTLFQCLHNELYSGQTLFNDSLSDSQQLENCLFDFERKRQIKLIPMMAAIHSMQTLFSCVPYNLLTAFNNLEFVKKQIISFANTN